MRLVARTWKKGDSSSDGHAVRPARATKAPRTHRTRTWAAPRALRSSSSDPDEALSHRLAADRPRDALAMAIHSAGHLVSSRLTACALSPSSTPVSASCGTTALAFRADRRHDLLL